MMIIIRRYYAGIFIVSLLLFSFTTLVARSPNTYWQNALIVIAGALTMSILCGTIYYLQDTKWGPKKREKNFSKSPFKELFQNGFIRQGDVMTGILEGYAVTVFYAWYSGKPAIKLDILFDPRIAGCFYTDEELKGIRNRNKLPNRFLDQPYEWTKNSIGYTLEYNFTPPSYEKLMKKAGHLIAVLKKEGLGKISYEETDKLLKNILSKD